MSHLVAAPSCARGSPLQEERNVRSELGREAPKLLAGSIQREQSIRAEEKGGNPSEHLYRDRPTLVNVILWGLALLVILYWPAT